MPVVLQPSNRPRVLIVDDDDDMQAVVSIEIQSRGMDPVAFPDPVVALEYLRTAVRIDAVVTDLQLPHMNGLEFALQLAKAHPALPVILMTGHPDMLERALTVGALPLVKPFSGDQLASVLAEALSRGRRMLS